MSEQDPAQAAVGDFLRTRRDKISPADVGLPDFGSRRRVKGLRREEVALLAGMSPEYYIRLERGRAAGLSSSVVDAVAGALRLDDVEREHLDRLLAALRPDPRTRRRPPPKPDTISTNMQVLLDSLDHLPALIFNGRLDIVAANSLARALYSTHFDAAGRAINVACFLFLEEDRARRFWPQWDTIAGDVVAILRHQAGRNPDDPRLIELVGQLSTRSEPFRTRWAANDVRRHRAGIKVIHHDLVGELRLPFENLQVDASTDQVLTVFTPRSGSSEHDSLALLASWQAAGGGQRSPADVARIRFGEPPARGTSPNL